jgi:hypothetical protein
VRGGRGVGEGWAGKRWVKGGLVTFFNIYISHVTSKINEGGGTLRKFFLVSYFL